MNAALILQLAITALTHATELNAILVKAQSEGRDVTDDEVAAAAAGAQAAIDAFKKKP